MGISYPNGLTNTQAGLAMAATLFKDFSAGEMKQRTMQIIIRRERNNQSQN